MLAEENLAGRHTCSSFNKTKFLRFNTNTCPKQALLKSKKNFKERREMKAARENTAS